MTLRLRPSTLPSRSERIGVNNRQSNRVNYQWGEAQTHAICTHESDSVVATGSGLRGRTKRTNQETPTCPFGVWERERCSEWERGSGTTTASGVAIATSTAAAISVVTTTVGCRHHQLSTPCCASFLQPNADTGLPNRLDYWPPSQCHYCPANPRDNCRWGRIKTKA